MRLFSKLIIIFSALFIFACAEAEKPSTPFNTLEAYTKAIKKKDTTTMKLLLSEASIKMAEAEARSQNTTLDEVIKRETLFGENQTSVTYRNEKIDGERATIEMKDSFNTWNTVSFVREEDVWKIDKQSIADQMMREIEQKNRELDDLMNQGRQP